MPMAASNTTSYAPPAIQRGQVVLGGGHGVAAGCDHRRGKASDSAGADEGDRGPQFGSGRDEVDPTHRRPRLAQAGNRGYQSRWFDAGEKIEFEVAVATGCPARRCRSCGRAAPISSLHGAFRQTVAEADQAGPLAARRRRRCRLHSGRRDSSRRCRSGHDRAELAEPVVHAGAKCPDVDVQFGGYLGVGAVFDDHLENGNPMIDFDSVQRVSQFGAQGDPIDRVEAGPRLM